MHSSVAPASLMGDLIDYQDLADSYSATYPVSSMVKFVIHVIVMLLME